MKKFTATVVAILMAVSTPIVFARAGTLIKCEGISTTQGYKYVGTYCADYQCKYVITRVFDSYCPYSL